MKLYFVRHGESEANVLREISNRGVKHGLTEKGRHQVTALADKLHDIQIRKIFSSPLLRATQTAEILSNALGVAYEITGALREFDCGIAEGRSDPAAWEMHHALVREWLERGNYDARIEQGESFNDWRQRLAPFIEKIVDESADVDNIVLIGHGGTFFCLLPLVLNNVDYEFAAKHLIGNAGYIVAEKTRHGLRCLEWAGTRI